MNRISMSFPVTLDAPSEVQARAKQLVVDALDKMLREKYLKAEDRELVEQMLKES